MLSEQAKVVGEDAVMWVSIQILDCIKLTTAWMDQVYTGNRIGMERVETSLVNEICFARVHGLNELGLHLLYNEYWHLRRELRRGGFSEAFSDPTRKHN